MMCSLAFCIEDAATIFFGHSLCDLHMGIAYGCPGEARDWTPALVYCWLEDVENHAWLIKYGIASAGESTYGMEDPTRGEQLDAMSDLIRQREIWV